MSVDLEKLEALAKNATPGPWHKQGFDVYAWKGKRREFVARTAPVVVSNSEFITRNMNDSGYIVAACNSLPDLIAELKAARAENTELKNQLREAMEKY